MTRQEILVNVFTKLRLAGFVSSQKEFAAAMDYNNSCISSAMNGVERYLTDRLFKRILRAYPCVNPNYLKKGEGEILIEGATATECLNNTHDVSQSQDFGNADINALVAEMAAQREMTHRAQEQTERALAQVDQLIEIIKKVTITPAN